MDIARLQVVVTTEESRRQVAALRADLSSLATSTNTGTAAAQQHINQLGQQARRASNTARSAARDMEREYSVTMGRIGGYIAAAFSVRELTRFGSEAVRTNLEFRRMSNIVTGLAGSAEGAKEQMAFLATESDRLGLNFRQAGMAFIRFEAAAKGSSITQGQLREIFLSTAEAALKMGATTAQQERIFVAFQQMISKGVVSMEELRQQLGDSLPGAFQIGARAMGVTTREFMKMVESGKLLTQDFLPKFARQLKTDVVGAIDELGSSLGRTQNAWDRFKNAIGEQLRPGVKAASDAIGGALDTAAQGMTAAKLLQGVKGNDELTLMRALRKEFPDASKPVINPRFGPMGVNFGNDFDFFKEYARMEREQKAANALGPGYSFDVGGLNLPEIPAAEEQDPQLQARYEKELNRLTLERLDGRERIIESYRQEKDAVYALGLPMNKEAELVTLIQQTMGKALEEESMKGLAEQARSLSDEMQNLAKDSENLFMNVMSDSDRQIAKVNSKFQENLMLLIQLEEYGANTHGVTYEDIVRSRDEAISAIEEQNSRVTKRRGDRTAPGFGDVIESWGNLEQRMKQGSAEIASSLDQNFTDAFTSMIMGTQSVSQAFKSMAMSIVSDLVRIAVQQTIVRSILQLGGALGANASTDSPGVVKSRMLSDVRGAYVQHNGGIVGGYAEGPIRRLHNGGMAGDEQAVVARRGEVFFTPEQMKTLGSTISGAVPREKKVEIVNVMDASYFSQALVKNKNTIVNIIGSESKTIRRSIS